MSRIVVVGGGYVGVTTGACFADLGNEVSVVDIDAAKINSLAAGVLTFFEPGLGDVLRRNTSAGRLRFTMDLELAMDDAEFVFIAVATPTGEGGEADLSAVESAARSIARACRGPLTVVNKSTVPVGTGDIVERIIRSETQQPISVVSNPEFLREGSAIQDFLHPDRVVIGSHQPAAADSVASLYDPLKAPIIRTDLYTAELIKYAANAFLAMRISFINQVAGIAEQVGADVKQVANGIGLDHRIGTHFLEAGLGFGGSCFPKDVRALAAAGRRMGVDTCLFESVLKVNDGQRALAVEKLRECLGTLDGALVALFGLSFKPDTDDLRESPGLEIARILLLQGARVRAYDPAAMPAARRQEPALEFAPNAYAAARGADAIIVATEWNEFRQLDLVRLKRLVRRPVMIDGRNLYDPARMRELGFVYRGIGRN